MKHGTLKIRLLAVLLTLCLLVGLAPVYAVSVGDVVKEYTIDGNTASNDGNLTYDADGKAHLKFTPDESGHYYMARTGGNGFSDCSDGAAINVNDTFDFDDDENDRGYYGFVYNLTGGSTYCFVIDPVQGEAFDLKIKKVEVASSFSVPATMEGYAGQVLPMPIDFDENHVLSTEVLSSDPSKVNPWGGNARREDLQLLAEGTATITVTSHTGQVETCVVTVKAPETISVNETKTVSLQGGERIVYSFTPTQSGTYTMYVPSDYEQYPAEFHVEGAPYAMWQAEDRRGASAFNLQAGQTYVWEVSANWDMTDCPITMVKADAMTGLAMAEQEITAFVGAERTIEVVHTPVFGMDREIVWSSDNPAVAEVCATALNCCNIRAYSKGVTNITASWVDDNGATQTATCKVTVQETIPLVLDQTEPFSLKAGESAAYSFTAGSNGGEYLFSIPSGPRFRFEFNGPTYSHHGFHTDDFAQFVNGIHPNETLILVITAEEDMTASSLTVTEATHAADISLTDGNAAVTAIEGSSDEVVRISMELIGGNYLSGLFINTQDPQVARIENVNEGAFDIWFNEEGTTTITVEADNGIRKDLTVTTKAYGDNIADKWIGTMQEPEQLRLEYTPAHDGFYYFHYNELPRIIPAEGSALPVYDFDYDDGRYHGVVYKLQDGQTYQFVTEDPVLGDYAVYLTEVQEATSFSIPATMTGPVDESHWLEVTYTGAMAPRYESTNEDIVRVGGSNAHGVSIFLIAEGTADIIVTDHNGNQQVCTVTISGKKAMEPFDGWKEMGLAAGQSVTYYYTPEESGLYWINSELNHKLGIELTENGAVVDPEYVFNCNDKCGKVYDLTAGTQYMLTFSSDHSMSTFINSERAEEATGLSFRESEIHGMVGEELYILYDLLSSQWTAVADISAKSSNEDVAKVMLCDGARTRISLVGEGTAEIIISMNGVDYRCIVVAEGNGPDGGISEGIAALQLGETVTVNVQPNGEVMLFGFVPEYTCFYNLTVTTEGASSYATD